jgi:hypothetical protein
MSIRQHRFDSIEKIKSRIAEFKGKKITLVLSNSTSVLGELVTVEDGAVVLINGRLKKVRFSYQDIKEMYFDQIV